eukprot:tig00021312_g20083.t1
MGIQRRELEIGGSAFVLRSLEVGDFHKGFLQLLGQLTTVGDVTEEMFIQRVREIEAARDHYHTVVLEDAAKGRVVASARLLVERKFTRGCSLCGHIEDVVVDETYRGKNLGKCVIDELVSVAKAAGCYKVILDCADKNVPFYEKCGFKLHEVHMSQYL